MDAGIARMHRLGDDARRRSRAVDTAVEASQRDRRGAGHILSGAIAFRLFLWLLPVALLLAVFLGFASSAAASSPTDVAHDAGLTGTVVKAVSQAGQDARSGAWITLPFALWAVYSSGIPVLKVLRTVHALVWRVEEPPLRRKVLAAAALLGTAVAVVGVVILVGAARKRAPGLGLLVLLAELIAVGALWLAIERWLPHPELPWTKLLPGAALVAGGAIGLHALTVFYLAGRVAKASETYGALGTALVTLGWLYLVGRLIVGSAMLNATLWERGSPSPLNDEHPAPA